jgi:outer membrane protein assembly factor BamB
VVAGGSVYIADRGYILTCLDAATGALRFSLDKVAGVGLSEDAKSLYLRKSDGNVSKADLEGKEIWSVQGKVNSVPTAPVEKDSVVYFCSPAGLVNAVQASDGKIIWQYQATPRLYVLSSISVADGIAYVSGMDGSLTAIRGNP